MEKIVKNGLFMNAFHYSILGMAIISNEGKWLKVNDALGTMLGYTKEELLQYTYQDVTYPEDWELEQGKIQQLLKGKMKTLQLTKRFLHKNGPIIWTDLSAILVKVNKNQPPYIIAQIQNITEIKELKEEKLRERHECYRALVESSPLAIAIHQGGKIVYANPRFKNFLKASSRQIVGQSILQFVHPDYQAKVLERIEKLENKIPVPSIEEKYVLNNGETVDVEVTASPMEYMGKHAFQVIVHDITKRKAMERELNKTQELYRSVIENVKEVIFHTDRKGCWTFLNPVWEEITGFTLKESIGKPFYQFLSSQNKEKSLQEFTRIIARKRSSYRKEVQFKLKQGGYCWFEVVAKAKEDKKGNITGILGVLNDISQRKKSEEKWIASEEKFRLLAEYSSDMITLHDSQGKYLYASPACKDILKYDSMELIGADSYSFIHPEDIELVKNNHQTLLEKGYVVSTYRIRSKNGDYVWFESSIKLLKDSSGEQKLIVVSRNINERKLTEQKLKEANELLQHISTIDGLTGIKNRRAFNERIELEWERGLRNKTPLSLIMLDIDYFKNYNDTYGHLAGDDCLKSVAQAIQQAVPRKTDIVCRYGGEEFAIILPDTDLEGALLVGERIRSKIEELNIPHSASKVSKVVTGSIGVASMIPNKKRCFVDLISSADDAVYKAKEAGRNQVQY